MKLKSMVALLTLALTLGLTNCGGGSSGGIPPPPPPPPSTKPTISSISPTSAAPGSADLELSVTGSNFGGALPNRSEVAWGANGTITFLTTTFVSSSQLTAVIPAALLINPVVAEVFLETGDQIEGTPLSKSNAIAFTVKKPSSGPPSISSVSPTSAAAGSSDLSLTIMGVNFAGTTHNVRRPEWSANGTSTRLSATSASDTQFTVVVPAAFLSSAIVAQVFIAYGDPMGDVPLSKSNSVNFSVLPPNSPNVSVSPSSATLGPTAARQFVYAIKGKAAAATWVVEEGAAAGTITSDGLYTAPSNPGTFHLVATAVEDPSKIATAEVSVATAGFRLTGSMATARSGHTATLLSNGKVLIIGGDEHAELFDPSSGTFSPTGNLTTTRYGPTAALLADGRVLISGGFGPGVSVLPRLNSAELYDPQSGNFAATGSMAIGRVRPTATLLNDGRVLIAGGVVEGGGGGKATASTELYDPATGTFTVTGSMISARASHTATLLASGKVLIIGGWNGNAADAADDPPWDPLFAELFNPASGSFTATENMSTTRIGHSAIRLADGNVLALGGVLNPQNLHVLLPDPQEAELYNSATGTFSPVGNVTLSRFGFTATLLNNGSVLIVGGEEVGAVVSSAKLLDPATGELTVTGELLTGRTGHTATRLNDGRVLVTGGTDSNGNALASAELYQ